MAKCISLQSVQVLLSVFPCGSLWWCAGVGMSHYDYTTLRRRVRDAKQEGSGSGKWCGPYTRVSAN